MCKYRYRCNTDTGAGICKCSRVINHVQIDYISELAKREKSSMGEFFGKDAAPVHADMDLPQKIIIDATDRIGKPVLEEYRSEDLVRTGENVLMLAKYCAR